MTKGMASDMTQHAVRATRLNDLLASEDSLDERLRLIRREVGGRIAFSTSLGLEDQAILHGLATAGVDVDVFTLDTGRLFPETIDTVVASETRYGLQIRMVAPDAAAVQALTDRDGALGFRQSVAARQACCAVRKIEPLRRALAGAAGWVTGLRRGQSTARADVAFAAYDGEFGLLKFNPIADWDLDTLERYVARHDPPINPLHRMNYPSIGCQPCTRPIAPGEDIRNGRWWWERDDANVWGKECGLHVGASAAAAGRS